MGSHTFPVNPYYVLITIIFNYINIIFDHDNIYLIIAYQFKMMIFFLLWLHSSIKIIQQYILFNARWIIKYYDDIIMQTWFLHWQDNFAAGKLQILSS